MMQRPTAPVRHGAKGYSLLELLTSMVLLSVIVLMLSSALELTMKKFRGGVDRSENVVATQVSLDWIQNDLRSAVTERYANLPPLPASVPNIQRYYFENRIFQLIEINRKEGIGLSEPRSFQNGHPHFDSMVFVAKLPIDAQFSVSYDRSRRSEVPASVSEKAVSWEAMAHASLVGYYVAYTYDSPIAGERRGSMRLHRHYRVGDSLMKQGYASGLVMAVSNEVNDAFDEYGGGARPLSSKNRAKVRLGKFANSELPYTFSRFISSEDDFEGKTAIQPWPKNPVPDFLPSPPPTLYPLRGMASNWEDPKDEIHDTVFPDEPIAHNVVRFELKPYRQIQIGPGQYENLDAADMNKYLKLESEADDWPALVRPDFIDITLSIIKESAARRLKGPDDWIVDWTDTDPNNWSPQREVIEQNLHTFHLRVQLNAIIE